MPHDLQHIGRQTFGIAIGHALPDIMLQRGLGILARHDRLLRILVGEFLERERAATDDLHGSRESLPVSRKQPLHFFRRLQIAISVALALEADFVDRRAGADAGDNVLQLPAAWLMEEDIIGDDRSHLKSCCEIGNLMQAQLVVLPAPQTKRHIGAITK